MTICQAIPNFSPKEVVKAEPPGGLLLTTPLFIDVCPVEVFNNMFF